MNTILNDQELSVTYPISEIIRRANLKIKIHDRDIPMTSDMWGGMMPNLVDRWRKFNNWQQNGVHHIKVFYDPTYFYQTHHTVELMDPLHMFYVLKYAGLKD